MDAFIQGALLLSTPENIGLIAAGVLIGVVVGALPGLSSPMAIALLIPFTIQLEPVPAIAMMAALYCAGTFGGSITAILINAPGAPPAVATALDGYPMAKNGEPGRALGIATISSVTGGIISLLVFIVAAPALASVALEFGPQEYFALAVFALSMLASMSGKSSIRNMISGFVGVLIGTIGIHLTTGVERFTFGFSELDEGISFIPVLIGLFAMGEMLSQSQTLNKYVERIQAKAMRLPTMAELKSLRGTILRSSGIGTFIGILPAEGSTVAAIIGYNEAKRFSKTPEKFGTGHAEGIAGPEAANNAAAGGAMVPTLALGIPGSGSTALILAALIMHGLRPGPYLLNETPEFLYAIFIAMLFANLAFLGIGLVGAKFFSMITFIPKQFLWPAVFVFSMIGAYSGSSSFIDVWVMMGFGIIGFFMNRHGFSAAPLVMGLILGAMVEETFSQSMIIYDNNFMMMFESKIVILFFALTVVSLTSPFWSLLRGKK
ncbi:tripartite tricarboxylate transporter permease [Alphaproteobacteria bacterium]|jgi:putative tricarboxylic transport membrane protein|nr:tripartite tricarboxylate transporter permease [Alphaproteobacteria bacterium]MDA8873612.1 tripartite tricarboxylate transporter permease [Alphaproteobacteria bacterium]MDA8942467.1 tripartite tricarboxylate transporter permease [Alphaproteobacteria bacterium]MDA9012936.1 tripartite tricarboxylate transporter permease [Alphaproteobacteria bacterium]MDA9054453.1 tripartite tricarboxylate transporter permease [Alphaproteobacteria bacterium]